MPNDEAVEQSFGLVTGRYRHDDGRFHDGSPPTDYDATVNRFRANDGQFKDRSKDLAMGEPFDAPAEDAATSFGSSERGAGAIGHAKRDTGIFEDLP